MGSVNSVAPPASSIRRGIIEIATQAEIGAGSSGTLAMTPGSTFNTFGFSKGFVSAAQTITGAGTATLGHSIGRSPMLWGWYFVCATAEAGYSVGDKVSPFTDNTHGIAVWVDGTNISFRAAAGNPLTLPHKTTGSNTQLTNANWNVVLWALG